MVEFFLSDMDGRKFQGTSQDRVGGCYCITHDCPFCGQKASTGRSLVWIASECLAKGQAIFPCSNCGQLLTVPSAIFAQGCLESLEKAHNMHGRMTDMSLSDLLVPTWGQIIFKANKTRLPDVESMKWDGRGSCPGCGQAQQQHFAQKFQCVDCGVELLIDQALISRTGNTNMKCSRCGRCMVIPAAVWCPVCGRNLRSSDVIERLFKAANQTPR